MKGSQKLPKSQQKKTKDHPKGGGLCNAISMSAAPKSAAMSVPVSSSLPSLPASLRGCSPFGGFGSPRDYCWLPDSSPSLSRGKNGVLYARWESKPGFDVV